jgi:hypothetical protein
MPENVIARFHGQNGITHAYTIIYKTTIKEPENMHEVIQFNEKKRSFYRTELHILHPQANQTNKYTCC